MSSPKSLAALLGLALACPAIVQAEGIELGQVLIRDQELNGEDQPVEDATVTVKRKPMGSTAGEPTVQDLLKARGIALGAAMPPPSSKPVAGAKVNLPSGVKRKGVGSLGIKVVKKTKA